MPAVREPNRIQGKMDCSPSCSIGLDDDSLPFETIARHNLEEALAAISADEKSAYLEAMEFAPRLVETESDPMCFLQCENFNSWDAAQRLVTYWRERKNHFGARAFLPFTLDGKGAPSDGTICALREGTILVLPNDNEGRSVFRIRKQQLYNLPLQERIQVLFYTVFVAMKNPMTHKKGLVFLMYMDELSFHNNAKVGNYIVRNAMPVQVHALHFVCRQNTTMGVGHASTVLDLCRKLTEERTYIHFCKTEDERAAKLLPYGFTKEHLPNCLGGFCEEKLLVGEFGTCDSRCSPLETVSGQELVTCNLSHQEVSSTYFEPSSQISSRVSEIPSNLKMESTISHTEEEHLTCDSRCSPPETVSGQELVTCNLSHQEVFSTCFEPSSQISSCVSQIPSSLKMESTISHTEEEHSSKRKSRSQLSPEEIASRRRKPGQFDVLLGKGRKHLRHTGNRCLQMFIETNSARYESSSRTDIKRIKNEIFSCIYPTGRFLNFDAASGEWYEISNQYALEKIGQLFRNYRKKRSTQIVKLAKVVHT